MQLLSRIACLGVAAFLVAPGASAQQQTPLTFQAFSLSNFHEETDGFSNPPPTQLQLTVLSDSAGVTRIGLDSFAYAATAASGGLPASSLYQLSMQLSTLAGYKITGFAFSGDLEGVLDPARTPVGYSEIWPGKANNEAYAKLGTLTPGGQRQDYAGVERKDVAGAGQFGFQSNGSFLPDDLSLLFNAGVIAKTEAAYYADAEGNERRAPSYASMRIFNPVLTIYSTALPSAALAVPEPSTWMMLLAGLALPWAARRAKARQAAQ